MATGAKHRALRPRRGLFFFVVARLSRARCMATSAVIDSLAPREYPPRCVAEAFVVFGRLYGATGGILYGAVSIFVGGLLVFWNFDHANEGGLVAAKKRRNQSVVAVRDDRLASVLIHQRQFVASVFHVPPHAVLRHSQLRACERCQRHALALRSKVKSTRYDWFPRDRERATEPCNDRPIVPIFAAYDGQPHRRFAVADRPSPRGRFTFRCHALHRSTGSIRLLSHTTYESRPASSMRLAYTIPS